MFNMKYCYVFNFNILYQYSLYMRQQLRIQFITAQLIFIPHNNFQAEEMATSFTRKKIQNYSYGLADVIGKGYSSQVYTGRDDNTNQKVAIKVIDMKMLKNEINRVLLQSEMAILRQLKNQQNILNVHEIYTTKNNTYIITELCDTDLNKLLKNKLTQQQACGFMEQIINGYANFARKDIIHRDLKPANILATQDRKLKIADFGFAIKVQDAAKCTKYNVGSPLYMAPESLKRNQYTLKSDIWALGVIFFELLTGQTPWKARNQKELIRKIQSEEIEKLLEPMTLQNNSKLFLRKTLRMDKSQRFTLEDVCKFKFKEVIERILSEKTTNVSLSLKSSTKNEISINIMSPKKHNYVQNKLTEKASDFKKLSKDNSSQNLSLFQPHESFNQSIQMKSTSTDRLAIVFDTKRRIVNKSTQKNSQNPENHKEDNLTVRDQKCDKKKISKILIAQIHFCRFLYKLLQRMIQSEKTGILREPNSQMKAVIVDFEGIIGYKIQNLLTFKTRNFIGMPGYEQYKQTTDYPKIMKIAQQYKERYSKQFKTGWSSNHYSLSSHNVYALIQLLAMLLEQSEKEEDFIKKYTKDIIVLDYLITAKQLIQMLQKSQNYEKFAEKSRIQEIVQGKTAIIHWGLYRRIMERSKTLIGGSTKKMEETLKSIDNLVQIY